MAAMKIRYPEGPAIDDLDVGQKYRIEFRGMSRPVKGELREIVLKRGKIPSLLILPDGKPHCIPIYINKIAKIEVMEVDLSNSDYRDDDRSDDAGECGGAT